MDNQALASHFSSLLAYPHWLVGYSGGLDSTVLLVAARAFLNTQAGDTPSLSAIHIDHQLSPNHSQWVEHCQRQCDSLDIPLAVSAVNVKREGKGLEQAAREMRYQVFSQQIAETGEGSVLLLAHHQDDQSETVLLRLLRGTGVRGIAAMRELLALGDYPVARPLLSFSRQQLLGYAEANGLQWVDDESNAIDRFDRNFLRLKIIPELEKRWPAAGRALARFSQHAGDAEQLLQELAAADLAQLTEDAGSRFGSSLDLSQLRALSAARRKNLYRYWLGRQQRLMPPAESIERLDSWLANGAELGEFEMGEQQLAIYRGRLYLVDRQWLQGAQAQCRAGAHWTGEDCLEFDGWGCLQSQRATNKPALRRGEYRLGVRQRNQQVAINGMHKSVHKLMQELGIPSWLRDAYPVIYQGDAVAAIPPLVADDFAADEGDGWAPHWQFEQAASE